jgi:transcription-repair coupling factor (superfamily II helicase)
MNTEAQNLISLKQALKEGVPKVAVTGLCGSSRSYFLSLILQDLERPVLILLPQAKDANRFLKEMEFFLPQAGEASVSNYRRLYDFPVYDLSPLTGLSPHKEVLSRRIQGLYALTSLKKAIVITSTEALLLKVMPKEAMLKALDYLEPGEEVNREQLLAKLEASSYLRTSLVEERGDYSVRGGVIDIFPPFYDEPVRLEFWGDRLESIRHFDPLSQRSTGYLQEMALLPANEILLTEENIKRARSLGRLPGQTKGSASFPGQEAWLNHYYPHLDTVLDYFPQDGLLIELDPQGLEAEAQRFRAKFQQDLERYRVEAEERNNPFPNTSGILLDWPEIQAHLNKQQCLALSELTWNDFKHETKVLEIKGSSEMQYELDLQISGKGRVSMAPLAQKIAGWVKMGARVVLVCRTKQQAQRLTEILGNYQVKVEETVVQWEQVSKNRGLSICLGRLAKGFSWPEIGLFIISEDEIFGSKRALAKSKAAKDGRGLNWTSFGSLKEGDFVVHQDHGIGRYGGLIKMEIEGRVNDFVIIEYANNDRLYLPADRISVLQKYVGADEKNPILDQLGGRSWDLVKKKAKKSIQEIAKHLVEIYALRKYRKGYAFSQPDNYYREFEATFEHEETSDQIKAIEDILSDLVSEKPMDRLICGDVGFGKTELAIRAAFKVVMDGKQVAILVPTTVLAEQHYATFQKRMESYPIKIGVLSRFKSKAEQKELVARLRAGQTDIVIGTHRLLQKDIGFKDLGLLIIDEEQRFGVKQKETLKKYRALVDVLALTATPIPRTLHLSLMGIRDLSIIETPPEDRLAIQTYLSHYDEATINHAIHLELERGGQVFFVHNRVQTITHVTHQLMRLMPQARFAVAHGQMPEKELEETMLKFLRRELDVLVCTTIIESGLDIPSVNTIIINEVDRFGLAQIYQLRGRVGRSKENAYAYLLLSADANLTREAEKRLKALMDFSQLGAGIHLAMHDLQIRGGGNILGFAQSGHIAAIGYELYIKMIEQSIAELKGEEWHEEVNPEINVNIPAFLPAEYIADMDVRLNLYRRLSGLRDEAELEEIIKEMKDRFGPAPLEVANLLQVMTVRLVLKQIQVSRLDLFDQALILTFSEKAKIDTDRLVRLAQKRPREFQFLSGHKLKVRFSRRLPVEVLADIRKIIRDLGLMPKGS